MTLLFRILFSYICCFISVTAVDGHDPNSTVTLHPKTTLILVGMRHGHRNPKIFLSQNRTWGLEEENELTSIGKRQSYAFGKLMRKFSGDLLSAEFMPNQIKSYSSSANRCQMTLQTFMAGLFPPSGFAKWSNDVNWTPIPYMINDSILQIYETACPNAVKSLQLDDVPELVEMRKTKNNLIAYVAKNTNKTASIKNTSIAADNIQAIILLNGTLPQWFVDMPAVFGYDQKRMLKEMLDFQEVTETVCARNETCRNMMAGVWLQDIVDALVKKINTDLKMIYYASHEPVTTSVMKLLGLETQKILDPSGGFLIEFRDYPEPLIRILTHDPTDNPDEHVISRGNYSHRLEVLCNADLWCPLNDFLDLIQENAISDLKKACGLKDGNDKKPISASSRNFSQLSCWTVILLVMLYVSEQYSLP